MLVCGCVCLLLCHSAPSWEVYTPCLSQHTHILPEAMQSVREYDTLFIQFSTLSGKRMK